MAKKLTVRAVLLNTTSNPKARAAIYGTDYNTLNVIYNRLKAISNKLVGEENSDLALEALRNLDRPLKAGEGDFKYIAKTDTWTPASDAARNVGVYFLDLVELKSSNVVQSGNVIEQLKANKGLIEIGRSLKRLNNTKFPEDGMIHSLPEKIDKPSNQEEVIKVLGAIPYELEILLEDYQQAILDGKDDDTLKKKADAIAKQVIKQKGVTKVPEDASQVTNRLLDEVEAIVGGF